MQPDHPTSSVAPSGHELRRQVSLLLGSKNECSPLLHKQGLALVREHEQLMAEVEQLREERELGPQTQACDNPSCSVMTFGLGYEVCPRCGEPGVPRG